MNAHCRIGRVHFKNGGATLTVLQPPVERSKQRCRDDIMRTIEQAEDVAGYAFVAWSPDGSSITCMDVSRSNIPSMCVPDFVRNRLLAYKIESWTIETVNENWGAP